MQSVGKLSQPHDGDDGLAVFNGADVTLPPPVPKNALCKLKHRQARLSAALPDVLSDEFLHGLGYS